MDAQKKKIVKATEKREKQKTGKWTDGEMGCPGPTRGKRPTVAASRVWNSLPHHVTSAQSLPVFCSSLKTHLFSRSFRWLYCCACEVILVITDTLIAVLTYLLTYTEHFW